MSQPQYIGEFAPTHLRGRLVGLYGACFQFGSVFVGPSKAFRMVTSDKITDERWLDRLVLRINGH